MPAPFNVPTGEAVMDVDEVMHIANAYAAAEPVPTAAAIAVAFARAQLGTPYLWGGDGPAHGAGSGA